MYNSYDCIYSIPKHILNISSINTCFIVHLSKISAQMLYHITIIISISLKKNLNIGKLKLPTYILL